MILLNIIILSIRILQRGFYENTISAITSQRDPDLSSTTLHMRSLAVIFHFKCFKIEYQTWLGLLAYPTQLYDVHL